MTKKLGFLGLFRPSQLVGVRGLKDSTKNNRQNILESQLMRARGLKVDKYTVYAYNMKSQLTCMRGLKANKRRNKTSSIGRNS